jgi:hypothetical protein
MAADNLQIVLFSSADSLTGRFAVCGKGDFFWQKHFSNGDPFLPYYTVDEQGKCEYAAARKAVWLVEQLKKQFGLKRIRLNLHLNSSCLEGRADELVKKAHRRGIDLRFDHIDDAQNPARRRLIELESRSWLDFSSQQLRDLMDVVPDDSGLSSSSF